MTARGRLTITSGPDRGKSCNLAEETVRIGKSPANEIVLSDPSAADLHMQIVQREGRFAIFTPVPDGISIEGNLIPAERWVWLPPTALIQLTRRTALEFETEPSLPVAGESEMEQEVPSSGEASPATTVNGTSTEAERGDEAGAVPRVPAGEAPAPPKSRKTMSAIPLPPNAGASRASESVGSDEKLRRKRAGNAEKAERKTVTARFITDGPGDPLVKLGEDGHLPELHLDEGKKRPGETQEAAQTSPLWLILILAASFGMSLLMLFVDFDSLGSSAEAKGEARREIASYYTEVKGSLKDYQIRLRRAEQARSRRDYDGERSEYQQVLRMLRAEGRNSYTGVTGSPEKDSRLEELIGILLRE